MREVIFGTILVGAVGIGVYFMPLGMSGAAARPDYAMSVKEAKLLLARADLRKGRPPFGTLEVLVSAPQSNVVRYEAAGAHAALACSATLTAAGDEGIDVSTACTRAAPSDGAAAAAGKDITEIAFAEYVAATLGKRAFDEDKVRTQSAGAAFRNLPNMQRDALKMQRDMQQASDQMDAGEEPVDESAAYAGDQGSAEDYAAGDDS